VPSWLGRATSFRGRRAPPCWVTALAWLLRDEVVSEAAAAARGAKRTRDEAGRAAGEEAQLATGIAKGRRRGH
jgi:hypothetical protein